MKGYKILTSIYLVLFTACILYFSLYRNPLYLNNIISIIIIFGILLIIIEILVWADRLRKFLFSRTLFDLVSPLRFLFFMFCLGLSALFLNYYSLSSLPNNNILPDKLNFDVIEISAILGGLVLTTATIRFSKFDYKIRNSLLSVSFKLIIATVLLIFFTVTTYYAYKDGAPILFSWDFSQTQNILRGIFLIISILCFFIGQPLFIMGIIDLLVSLFVLIRKLTINVKYFGIKNNLVFHRSDCYLLNNTPDDSLISFSSALDAINRGYLPCPKCKPVKKSKKI